ncbi:MAG: tetratricopeptide repeat-containing sensor histidine kinase [Marinifilaceae bacterium]
MKKIFCIISILLIVCVVHGQTHLIDSLKNKIESTKESAKAALYFDITSQAYGVNLDTSAYYAKKAELYSIEYNDDVSLSRTLALKAYIYYAQNVDVDIEAILLRARTLAVFSKSNDAYVESYNISGAYYASISNFSKALEYFDLCYVASLKANNTKYKLRALNNIAGIYIRKENYSTAISYLTKGLELTNMIRDNRTECFLLVNLGGLYFSLNDIEKCFEYYQKANILADKNFLFDVSFMVLHNKATIYSVQKKYNLALEYYKKSISYMNKINNKTQASFIYGQIAYIYYKIQNKQLAYNYFEKSIDFSIKFKDPRIKAHVFCLYAEFLLSEKKYRKVKRLLYKSMSISKEHELIDIQRDVYKLLSELNYSQKKYKLAFENKRNYHLIQDSLKGKEVLNRAQELKVIYETNKTDLKNSILESKNELAESKLISRKYIVIGLIIIVVLLFAFAVIITQLYKKQVKSNMDLEEVNKTKDRLFSILSHDLRSPFNILIGFLNLLNDNKKISEDDELRKYSQVLLKTSENTLDLLDSVLAWAKTQITGFDVHFSDEHIKDIVDKSVSAYELSLSNKDIHFVNNCNCECMVNVDKNIMSTILRNLLTNAIKFTNRGGKVEIGTILENEKLIIYVKDNGVGMNKKDQEKLFAIDQKVSKIGTDNEQGTGFGLILVKNLSKLNGGDIWFESEENKGSTFYISCNIIRDS